MGVLTRLRHPRWLVWAALLGPAAARAPAQTPPPTEYEVKAAYLLNFTRYVEWPRATFPSDSAPIVIGVLGANPFGTTLARTVEGRSSQGRPIEVRQIDSPADARECELVFVSREEYRARPDVLGALRRRGLVTVGDSNEFAEAGGVLGFTLVDQTVRFVVNLPARDRAGLKISSRMLALAANVIRRDQGGK